MRCDLGVRVRWRTRANQGSASPEPHEGGAPKGAEFSGRRGKELRYLAAAVKPAVIPKIDMKLAKGRRDSPQWSGTEKLLRSGNGEAGPGGVGRWAPRVGGGGPWGWGEGGPEGGGKVALRVGEAGH